MQKGQLFRLREDIDLLIKNIDPQSKIKIEQDTILRSSYNKELLKNISIVIKDYLDLLAKVEKKEQRRKTKFYIDIERRKNIPISQSSISISAFSYTLNKFVDTEFVRKVKGSDITAWLTEIGYLAENQDACFSRFKVLTEKSASIGIQREERTNQNGQVYHVNVYGPEAQRFIIDHLDDISSRFE